MKSKNHSFESLQYRQISTPESRELRLEDKPAIYAWYRSLRFSDVVADKERFVKRIEEYLNSKLSDQFIGKLGYLYELSVQESPGNLSKKKIQLLFELSEDYQAREIIAHILDSVTFLQAPLYVGKAINLKERISEHVNGISNLINRLDNANISLQKCVLRYKYIGLDELEYLNSKTKDSTDSIIILIEDLLTRMSPAGFVRRPG